MDITTSGSSLRTTQWLRSRSAGMTATGLNLACDLEAMYLGRCSRKSQSRPQVQKSKCPCCDVWAVLNLVSVKISLQRNFYLQWLPTGYKNRHLHSLFIGTCLISLLKKSVFDTILMYHIKTRLFLFTWSNQEGCKFQAHSEKYLSHIAPRESSPELATTTT